MHLFSPRRRRKPELQSKPKLWWKPAAEELWWKPATTKEKQQATQPATQPAIR
jgi:hypothetical protein